MESDRIDRRLVALLSADVAGYSRLMAQDEGATIERIGAYREEVGLLVQQHRGRLVDFSGDNFLAEYPSASDAVRSAVQIQRVLRARNTDVASDHRLEFRMGVHLGDIRSEDGRLYGDGVNIAARLEALAEAGGVVVSSAVHEQVRGKLGLEFDHLGQRSLKNIPGPIRVYRVVLASGAARSRRGPKTRSVRIALAISILLLAAGGLVIAWSLTGGAPVSVEPSGAVIAVSSAAERPTIAVLPFVNISGDAEQEYFVDGMTEDLITDLSKVSGLLVVARNSTFTYKNKPVKVQEVGRELGAAYVVEGSVRRAGDRLRITAQLLESDSGHHLWAERYDRTITDIFTLQDEVVEKIVAALAVRFSERERGLVNRVPTDSLEAYDYFLRAKSYAWRLAKQDHLRARELFGKALELDPGFGAAYSWLALSHATAWFLQWTDDVHSMDRAVELAEKAVAVDSAAAGSHAVLGAVYGFAKRYDEGVAAARRSLELNPSDAMAYLALGTIANHQGRSEDALYALERSLRVDPVGNPGVFFHMGIAYQGLGRSKAAMANFRRATRLAPDFSSAHLMLAYHHMKAGHTERAAESVEEVLRINPDYSLAESGRRLPVIDESLRGDVAELLREAGLE